MRVVAALFAVAALAGVSSSGAAAQTLACGAVVKSNVTLDASSMAARRVLSSGRTGSRSI